MKALKNMKFALSLVTILALTACGPTTNPTTDVPSDDPTSTPTTEEPTAPSVSDPTTSIVYPEGVIDGNIEDYARFDIGDQFCDFSFQDLNGNNWFLSSEVNSTSMVVINFFASWCGPCKVEFPAMEATYRHYAGDVTFIALTTEPTDTVNTLKQQFQNRYDITFPLSFDKQNIYARIGTLLDYAALNDGRGVVPVTIFIDRYGTLVDTHLGSLPTSDAWIEKIDPFVADDYLPYGY